jgi:hypothetical protein
VLAEAATPAAQEARSVTQIDGARRAYALAVPDYVPQADDVAEATDRELFDGLRRLTPLQRLQIAARASRALHRLSVAGLRVRFPDASEEELARRAGALRLGPELTRSAFGSAAEAWLE